jgi:hypothetical protein
VVTIATVLALQDARVQTLLRRPYQPMRTALRKGRRQAGAKGIYWHTRDRVWQVSIRGCHLGTFETFEEAEDAYSAAFEESK